MTVVLMHFTSNMGIGGGGGGGGGGVRQAFTLPLRWNKKQNTSRTIKATSFTDLEVSLFLFHEFKWERVCMLEEIIQRATLGTLKRMKKCSFYFYCF